MGDILSKRAQRRDSVTKDLKKQNLLRSLLSLLSEEGQMPISEISSKIRLSIPKVTSMLNDLIDLGYVSDLGKDSSSGGRRPNVYGLRSDSVYFVGIDVHQDFVNIALTDFNQNLLEIETRLPFTLRNTKKCLNKLTLIIDDFICSSPISKGLIRGIGVNLSGRINHQTGYSYSFFHFEEDSLSTVLERSLGIPVFLENDSRAMAYGEYIKGSLEGEKNILFLNLDYGIGMGIIIDGDLYYGKSGYSGEFGHIPIFDNNKLCRCGKQGCLETEASGWALVEKFKEKIQEGGRSILLNDPANLDKIRMDDIIQAACNDDVLCIELFDEIGDLLGRGLAMLINIFNPELVIIGGSLSNTGDYIRLPIKSAMNRLSLSLMNNDTKLRMGSLGDKAGVLGACHLVRKKLLQRL